MCLISDAGWRYVKYNLYKRFLYKVKVKIFSTKRKSFFHLDSFNSTYVSTFGYPICIHKTISEQKKRNKRKQYEPFKQLSDVSAYCIPQDPNRKPTC